MNRLKLNIQKFASGTIGGSVSGYFTSQIVWSSTSNGSSANSSNVTAHLQIRRTNNYSTTGTVNYSLNINGNNYNGSWNGTFSSGWVEIASRTVTVGHNSDGTKVCNINSSARGPAGTSLSGNTTTASQNVTLDRIARWATMTGANNFNDEQNPRMTFSNPAGTRIDVWLEPNPNSPHLCIRNNIPNTGSYTWTLTEAERNQLRSACKGNSCKIRYGLYSYLSGSTRASYKDMTFSIVNGEPTFTNFDFEDTNEITLALTGDSSININGFSNTKITIPEIDKAIPNKQATMTKYRYSNGTQSIDIDYRSTGDVVGLLPLTTSGTHNVYAIDSRNNSTMVTKLSSREINYTPISLNAINCSAERDNNGVGTNCTLKLQGTFWDDSFGLADNELENLTYKIKKSNSSEWINGRTVLTPTIGEDGNFSFEGLIASDSQDYSWDISSSYNILIIAEDKLSYRETEIILGSGTPTISYDRDGVGILCAYDSSLGGSLQIKGEVIGQSRYSTDETEVGIWINGETIYRKVFEVNSFPNNANLNISSNVQNIDTVIKMEGYEESSNEIVYLSSAYNSSIHDALVFEKNRNGVNDIRIHTTNNRSSYSGYVWIEYTKNEN